MKILFVFVFGLCIGSFLNVVIYRFPKGQSVVFPPSQCPACGYRLRAYDLVPVLSWLFLGGKCRKCRGKISLRYPVIELLTGVLFVICFEYSQQIEQFIVLASFVSAMVVIMMIDYDLQIVPDELLIFLAGLALIANVYAGWLSKGLLGALYSHGVAPLPFLGWKALLLGAATGFGIMLAIFLLSRGGMGGGDVKLAAVLGLWLGWKLILLTLLLAFILGGLTGIILLALSVKKRKDPIPFAPFLVIAALAAVFLGQQIVNWYQFML